MKELTVNEVKEVSGAGVPQFIAITIGASLVKDFIYDPGKDYKEDGTPFLKKEKGEQMNAEEISVYANPVLVSMEIGNFLSF